MTAYVGRDFMTTGLAYARRRVSAIVGQTKGMTAGRVDDRAVATRRLAMLSACVRILGSLLGGIIMFAVWLIAVLARMPRPPVPPSFAVTITAPVVAAAGFGLGMLVAERLTQRRHGGFRGAFLWSLAGGTVGTLAMFPFGGMMAGFGLFGLGTAALLIREVLSQRHPRGE